MSTPKNLITSRWVIKSPQLSSSAKIIYTILRTDSLDKEGYSVTRTTTEALKKKTGIKSYLTVEKAMKLLLDRTVIKKAPGHPGTYFVAHHGPWDRTLLDVTPEEESLPDLGSLKPDRVPDPITSGTPTSFGLPEGMFSIEAFKKYLETKEQISIEELAAVQKKYTDDPIMPHIFQLKLSLRKFVKEKGLTDSDPVSIKEALAWTRK